MEKNRGWILVIGGLILLCACAVLAVVLAGGLAIFQWTRVESSPSGQANPTQVITVEVVPASTPSFTPTVDARVTESAGPMETPTATGPTGTAAANGSAAETLNTVENELIPFNDPVELAERLLGKSNIPEILEGPVTDYAVGDEKSFNLTNSITNETLQAMTKLAYETEHLYFWIEQGVQYDQRALERLCETFEDSIYPTARDYFGSEWTPGVDNDPHLYVVYARNLGGNLAGAYSASDEYHPDAREYSNAHEMFVINADNVDLGGEFIYSTMAHEFQHMIHWNQDRNEETWVSEGFSTLAQLLTGYEIGGSDFVYAGEPDMQLNTWPNNDDTFPSYGSSFLFASYFLDRFGKDAVKSLIAQPENGLHGFDTLLDTINAVDPLTGEPIRADDVFADWVVTSFLNDPDAGDGRYAYRSYPRAPGPDNTEAFNFCPSEWQDRDVRQYGADYIQVSCDGESVLELEGAAEVGVVPEDAYSGQYAFWSNKGDESDMTLTRTFDLTQVSGPVTLTYRAWYDIEADYDYLYLLASQDGEDWEILVTPSGTAEDPSGNSYGWGYNGASDGWIEESVDLSQYAGKRVQLRFEYITDMAVNGEGFLIDDIRIPEIQYGEDFEAGEGDWAGEGFVRIQNRLPQTFKISIIKRDGSTSVETVRLEPGQKIRVPLALGTDVKNTVVVVSGTTRYTTQPAFYRFRFVK